ncbi:erythroid differentiation-related factor 1 [Sitophilus oryzae]|uniref:Erythroid differentiation-related factor 1 n=1 Tax=Sitophilus oryzae TaxID=7048 RepID=A0A6J2YTE4_SITOR|nr:erythroid differentiation-related factor 1 [Sitophilus oryzae]
MSDENASPTVNKDDETNREKVKSRAIVKYSAPKPATFAKLQYNTDLNLPPSNWLSSSADSYGLQRVIYHQKGFSSFRMAHMYPDCVGEVDVVSDAENIKNLLKIPYHKGHISMMVHRVENTLLLDDFDIYKHLLKTSETEWEWLKKFFFENIGRETYEQDKHLYIKSRTQKALKEKSLVSKFLYHSLVEGDNDSEENRSPLRPYNSQNSETSIQTPPLPDPSPSTECPDSHPFEFNRNVVWTFEDIEMLLGTDMPIFGGGTHPCISLRLRDMSKPISVLTGIDYWLDNLMSNVPEVVMCYHINGIVQKYELIKTEDLPRLDNSKFSPKLIRDVAQSILSFLKSNATKAGHTYWLFKGKDEEVVKLYDLTSLCSEEDVQKGQNPFTIPVAMLLYRVGRNMKNLPDRRPQPGTIRMLLKNVIKLLPEEKYPEIITSSHYMLSDLYVPAEVNPEDPKLDQNEKEDDEASVYDDDDDEENLSTDAVSVLDLEKPKNDESFRNFYKPPPPINGSLEERCISAVGHVAGGLNCLQYFSESKEDEKKEEEAHMAKPFEPIPMPYGKLSDEKNPTTSSETENQGSSKRKKRDKKKKSQVENNGKMALIPKDPSDAPYPKWPTFDPSTISWKGHLKTLLFEKAVLIYAILAEFYITQGRYGECLRVLGILARCQLALDRIQWSRGVLRLSCLPGRAGDACLMIVQRWKNVEIYREQLQSHRDEDIRLLEKVEQDERAHKVNLGDSETKVVFIPDIRTIEQMLIKTVECYETALKMSSSESIMFRLANSLNELASYYLNVAKNAKLPKDIIEACNKSEPYLVKGLQLFEKANNDANIALLSSNMGHLHRLLAYAHTPEERSELTPQERKHYSKAFQSYKRALRVLGDRKHCPGIWDAVTWELSTALFTVSCILYENPPSDVSKSEAEKQVLEALQTALDHCDLDESKPKFPLYQYRAATLHFRMGSLWHAHAWNSTTDSKKQAVQLAQRHYDKAVKLFLVSGDALCYLTGQMQRVALTEFLVEGSSSATTKLKHLQACLDYFLDTDEILELLLDKKIEVSDENKESITAEKGKSFKSLHSLLKLVKTRLQHVLKSLVKLCLSKPSPNKESPVLAELYKASYKATFELSDELDCDALLKRLHKALREVKNILRSHRDAS